MEHTFFNQIETELIGYKVFELLENKSNTLISHSVFDHAIYINDSEDHYIKIIKDKEFISPTAIVVSGMDDVSFKSMDLQNGSELGFVENKITFKDKNISLDLGNALTWQLPTLSDEFEIISIEQINLNLRILRDIIYTAPSKEGLVPLLENVDKLGPMEVFLKDQKPTMSEKARPHIDALMWGLMSGDLKGIKTSAGSILGLGPGLTPSCDDFIAGLILSLKTLSTSLCKDEPKAIEFFDKMSEELAILAKEKTTAHSSWFIHESAIGEGPKAAVELIISIVSSGPQKVSELSKQLISIGATSGADIAIGIYYGIRFLTSRLELKDLDEFE